VGIHDRFFDLGGDSLTAAQLFVALEKEFRRKLPLSSLMEARTVAEQSRVLEDENSQANWSPVVPVQPEGDGTPIFCFAGKGGNPLRFRFLADLIGESHPLYFMQSRGFDGKWRPYERVPDIAADFLAEIRNAYPTGPYHLIGSSFGGLVAYEIAIHLPPEERGVVALLDTFGPGMMLQKKTLRDRLLDPLYYLVKHLRQAFNPDRNVRANYFQYYRDYFHLRRRVNGEKPAPSPRLPRSYQRVERANLSAARKYAPSGYDGEVVLFRAKYQKRSKRGDPKLGWGEVAIGSLVIHEVDSYHGDILFYPGVQQVHQHLAPALDGQARPGTG
jgi:thioesterase domain-containing protein